MRPLICRPSSAKVICPARLDTMARCRLSLSSINVSNRPLDRELSWTEAELPERERTKHVHRLHPYLGKFVPQLVEVFLRRCFAPGQRILDPFAGSGTTLVECSIYGANSTGIDISAFNVLLARVKTSVTTHSSLNMICAMLFASSSSLSARIMVSFRSTRIWLRMRPTL